MHPLTVIATEHKKGGHTNERRPFGPLPLPLKSYKGLSKPYSACKNVPKQCRLMEVGQTKQYHKVLHQILCNTFHTENIRINTSEKCSCFFIKIIFSYIY